MEKFNILFKIYSHFYLLILKELSKHAIFYNEDVNF